MIIVCSMYLSLFHMLVFIAIFISSLIVPLPRVSLVQSRCLPLLITSLISGTHFSSYSSTPPPLLLLCSSDSTDSSAIVAVPGASGYTFKLSPHSRTEDNSDSCTVSAALHSSDSCREGDTLFEYSMQQREAPDPCLKQRTRQCCRACERV